MRGVHVLPRKQKPHEVGCGNRQVAGYRRQEQAEEAAPQRHARVRGGDQDLVAPIVRGLFLGQELISHGLGASTRQLDETTMERRTAETMETLAVTTIGSIRQPVARLSGGQRQSVAVARAVMWNSKVVILDEPTAALGVAQTRQVLELVKRLAEQGLAVVIISHNLPDVFEVATRITVLRLGRNVVVFERGKTTQDEVVRAITLGAPAKSSSGEDTDEGLQRW